MLPPSLLIGLPSASTPTTASTEHHRRDGGINGFLPPIREHLRRGRSEERILQHSSQQQPNHRRRPRNSRSRSPTGSMSLSPPSSRASLSSPRGSVDRYPALNPHNVHTPKTAPMSLEETHLCKHGHPAAGCLLHGLRGRPPPLPPLPPPPATHAATPSPTTQQQTQTLAEKILSKPENVPGRLIFPLYVLAPTSRFPSRAGLAGPAQRGSRAEEAGRKMWIEMVEELGVGGFDVPM